jgi:pantetheine-phosphate adenylyltransferase
MYPGSFDPFTNGHLDILERARKTFSEIVIVVAGTGSKQPMFTPEERVASIKKAVHGRTGVRVDRWPGLIMDYAQKHQIRSVVRGLRAASDFEYEYMMASMNKKLAPNVETVFLMTSQDWYFVSSSMVRELARYGGDVAPYVPSSIVLALREKAAREKSILRKKGSRL